MTINVTLPSIVTLDGGTIDSVRASADVRSELGRIRALAGASARPSGGWTGRRFEIRFSGGRAREAHTGDSVSPAFAAASIAAALLDACMRTRQTSMAVRVDSQLESALAGAYPPPESQSQ
jgi:hypothetical protein